MTNVRLTKEFNFEMAHALWNYDGLCKNIHGHSYKMFVTVLGMPIADKTNPKLGMVMDFGDLKRIVNSQIVDIFDHSIVLSNDAPIEAVESISQMFDRKILMELQPTCENLIIDFVDKIQKNLPPTVKLHSLKLHETATSFAEWYASDN